MFKSYLTYNLALGFDQACRTLELPVPLKDRLLRSSGTMVQHFSRSLYTQDPKEQARCFFVALVNLRDTKDILLEAGYPFSSIQSKYDFLHERMEKLCDKMADKENGQFRLFG